MTFLRWSIVGRSKQTLGIFGGLAAIGLVTLATPLVFRVPQAKAATSLPSSQCQLLYAVAPSGTQPLGGTTPTDKWSDANYNYQVFAFGIQGVGTPPNNSYIDSYVAGNCNRSDGQLIKVKSMLSPGGIEPIGAQLGVPQMPGDNNGAWATFPNTASPAPSDRPPVYAQGHDHAAVAVDDGGYAAIATNPGDVGNPSTFKKLWCQGDQNMFTFFPATGSELASNCQDVTNPLRPGAGYLFTSDNCANATDPDGTALNCSDNNNFNWYRFWHPSTDITDIIGKNADGTLSDFSLSMGAVQSGGGGLDSFMYITFKYPKSASKCVSASASPGSVAPGATFAGSVNMQNTSGNTWNPSGAAGDPTVYTLANVSTQSGTNPVTATPAAATAGPPQRFTLPGSVAPNATTTVNLSITAPTSPGTYTYQWQMFHENVAAPNLFGAICSYQVNVGSNPTAPVQHKIFLANFVQFLQQFVRDNFHLGFNLTAYMWPDAGIRHRGSNDTTNLWLAGIWGNNAPDSNGTPSSTSSYPDIKGSSGNHTDPMWIGALNAAAEAGCPGTIEPTGPCGQRVPLAYVKTTNTTSTTTTSQSSYCSAYAYSIAAYYYYYYGTYYGDYVYNYYYNACMANPTAYGYTPPPPTSASADSPNGNFWYLIRQQLGVPGYSFDSRLGGIASNLTSSSCSPTSNCTTPGRDNAGYNANYLNNVEMSNIHVGAQNISATAAESSAQYGQYSQGNIPLNQLEKDSQPTSPSGNSLPSGSQGPLANPTDGSASWDNIRNPNKAGSDYAANIPSTSVEFCNVVSGSSCVTGVGGNFTADPINMDLNALKSLLQTGHGAYGTGNVTTLLQDGRSSAADHNYHNPSEPLSLTNTIDSAKVQLMWDEYIDWSQVDDKGHWYPTRGNVSTGMWYGSSQSTNITTYSFNAGYSQYSYTYYGSYCAYYYSTYPYNCAYTVYYSYPVYTSCSGSYGYVSGWYYNYPPQGYYTGEYQSKYGWINNSSGASPTSVTNPNYAGTGTSYFGPDPTVNPSWASTPGPQPYWQDTAVTPMDNGGSTIKPTHDFYWTKNTTDPLYTNRFIYDTSNSAPLPYGYTLVYSYSCMYPNGSGAYASGSSTATYNPSYGYLNESSSSSPGGPIVYGTYASGAAKDTNADGIVDTGWNWVANGQRVRYENTFYDRSRDMGTRIVPTDPTTYCSVDLTKDQYFLGPEVGCSGKPGRGTAQIGNPTIQSQNGDIFGSGSAGITSYFNGSNSSAFIFSNGTIQNFNSASNFNNYFNNPDRFRSNTVYKPLAGEGGSALSSGDPIQYSGKANCTSIASTAPTTCFDAVRYIFQNFDTSILGVAQPYSGPNLSSGNHIFVYNGDLTLGATQFCGGPGTIVVTGKLNITGQLSYCNPSNPSDPSTVTSVGFIVGGNISVDPSVTSIVGAYFSNGSFSSGTNIGVNDRTTAGDLPLAIQGLVVANTINLDRQPTGALNCGISNNTLPNQICSSQPSETFTYDGRVVTSPPPGFTSLYSGPAVWNESVTPSE